MNLPANSTLTLTVASLKMYFRDRQALFWSLLLPLMFMIIFGLMNFGSLGRVDLGVVDLADNSVSQGVLSALEEIDALAVSRESDRESARAAVEQGDRDLVLVIPAGFGPSDEPLALEVLFNEARARESEVGFTVLRQVFDELSFSMTDARRLFVIDPTPAGSRNLRYIDFLMPGIVAMSIMQMGLFSVAFAFVQLKRQGILRRLLATPMRPASFIFAYVVTRLTVSILQTGVLVGVAVLFFDVQIAGNVFALFLLALIGGAVFIGLGFAVSGWARSEETAAPIANVIALPMIFLSGVFFPREAMPDILETVTGYLPLTYLADSLRSVSVDGAALSSQWVGLAGLAVWLVVTYVAGGQALPLGVETVQPSFRRRPESRGGAPRLGNRRTHASCATALRKGEPWGGVPATKPTHLPPCAGLRHPVHLCYYACVLIPIPMRRGRLGSQRVTSCHDGLAQIAPATHPVCHLPTWYATRQI